MTISGQTHSLAPGPISAGTLAAFADASGDHNPIHLDIEAARNAGLRDVIAHGTLSMGYLGRLLTDNSPQSAIRSFRVRFVAITPLHADPTFTAHVVAAQPGRTSIELSAFLPDGTTTVTGAAIVGRALT